MMDKIKFKESKIENIIGIFFLMSGLYIMFKNGIMSIEGLFGLSSTLFALHFFHSSEISSIKKYLNEQRRKNGIK